MIYLLVTTPILKIVYTNEVFLMCIDACKNGLSKVLPQIGYVISYKSMELKDHQTNYGTQCLKLIAIINAYKIWRHYLIDRKIQLKIHQSSLKYSFESPRLNARKLNGWNS